MRSFVFSFFFYATTLMFLIIGVPWYAFTWRGDWILKSWSHLNLIFVRYILNIKIEVSGQEILKKYPGCILACQHQSAFETVILFEFCNFAFVYKDELKRVPIFGKFMEKSGMIKVDRTAGAKSLKQLLQQGKIALQKRGGIIIFPQGRRMPVGQVGEINAGTWALYHSLKVPVIPVTLDSGVCWPPKKFLKFKGTIHLTFHPPLEEGLNREDFESKLKELYSP
jgi:1-acyl-sn-glycerol-3-phosphate acyltransferase